MQNAITSYLCEHGTKTLEESPRHNSIYIVLTLFSLRTFYGRSVENTGGMKAIPVNQIRLCSVQK
jgi:hypothetical protein